MWCLHDFFPQWRSEAVFQSCLWLVVLSRKIFWEQVNCGSSLRSRSRLVQLCVDQCCRTSSISLHHVICHDSEDAHDRLSEGHCYRIMRYLGQTRSCSWSLKNGTSEAHMKKKTVVTKCACTCGVCGGGFNRSKVHFQSTCLYNEISGQAYQSQAYHREICCLAPQRPAQ